MSIKSIFNRRAMKRVVVYGALVSAIMLNSNYNNQLQWGEDTSLAGKVNRVIVLNTTHRDATSIDDLSAQPENSRRHRIGEMIAAIEKTPTGKLLVDFARAKDVRFSESALTDEGGVFDSKLGISGLNVDIHDPTKGGVYVLAHELFHPVQTYKQLNKNLDAKDMIRYLLATEGAAEVAAIRVTHEMMVRGDSSAWNWENKRLPADYKLMQSVYDGIYQASMSQGKTMEESEDVASRATYRLYFSEPVVGARLLRIENAIAHIAHSDYKTDLSRTQPLTLNDMRAAARLPNGFDFVGDKGVLPDACDIDGGLALVRQAINAAYAYRHGLDFDADPNPELTYGIFKNVDMGKAVKLFDKGDSKGDMMLAMVLAQGHTLEQVGELMIQAQANDNAAECKGEHFRLPVQIQKKPAKRFNGKPLGFGVGI